MEKLLISIGIVIKLWLLFGKSIIEILVRSTLEIFLISFIGEKAVLCRLLEFLLFSLQFFLWQCK